MAILTTTPAHKPTVRRGHKSYTYHVESRTRRGVFYVADVYHLTCTCPAGRARRGCWHLRLALAWHDWRKRQLAQAAAPTVLVGLQEAAA
jgi:hypothetical protein